MYSMLVHRFLRQRFLFCSETRPKQTKREMILMQFIYGKLSDWVRGEQCSLCFLARILWWPMVDSFSPEAVGTLLPPHPVTFFCLHGEVLTKRGPPPTSPHWLLSLCHPDKPWPLCCCNCRFDHSLHFVRPHHIQALLIGNSGLPKARQPGDQGQLLHCLVFKLVPSWRSDHHQEDQEAGDSEMGTGAWCACERGRSPLSACLHNSCTPG